MSDSLNVVITGGSSGLGRALVERFCNWGENYVYNLSRDAVQGDTYHEETFIQCDVTVEQDLIKAKRRILDEVGPPDILINNAGINALVPFADLLSVEWDAVMDTNVKGILLASQVFLSLLEASSGTILNIVSNASHVPMTHSAAYNASKAAAHMLTLQMARELTKSRGITVFGISPAKIKGTGMSKYIEASVPTLRGWTEDEARQYQINGLVTGEEILPETLAEFVHWLLAKKSRHFHLSGCVLPYGA